MTTHYHSLPVHGIDIFYREAGPRHAPTVVLLHGFPSSSHMYRDLIPHLASRFHVVAPDYPGFGNSAAPAPGEYAYTFENLAAAMEEFLQTLGVERYTLYMQDYGGPVGFRLAARHPEKIQALIIQNANAYEEGISESLAPLANYSRHQPPTLIVWGKNDPFFTTAGAEAYKKHLPNAELHSLDGGHFVLEEAHEDVAARITAFLSRLEPAGVRQ